MPKPHLIPEQSILESQMIETMLAGLKNWRPDLHYPESHSDMEACVRGLMAMFEIKRRPLPVMLKGPCDACMGTGYFVISEFERRECPKCQFGKVDIAP